MLNNFPLPSGLKYFNLSEAPFALQLGESLPNVTIGYQTFGELNSDRSNTVLVLHALTGNTNCVDWWSGIIGQGRSIDPERDFVVCANLLGSCYGSTGPTDQHFPEITIRDIARTQLEFLIEFGIRDLQFAIGGSMGAMVLLELALLNQEFGCPINIERIAAIATGAAHSAWRLAFSSTIRRTIEQFFRLDPINGFDQGMKLARQFAMTSYRSKEEFDERFGRTASNGHFEVENYLIHQGEKIAERFSPHAYSSLTRAMELYDLREGRDSDIAKLFYSLKLPILFIGISSDILYTEHEIRLLATLAPSGTYRTLSAPYGHDSFLIKDGKTDVALDRMICEWLAKSNYSYSTKETLHAA
jgi:homoserine O-acetyltransferase